MILFFLFKQKTAYEMRISDWSSDVCSSDLKATMEFEAIDEGIIAQILVPEGSDNVKVGTVIAVIAGEGEDASSAKAAPAEAKKEEEPKAAIQDVAPAKAGAAGGSAPTPAAAAGGTELPSRPAGATAKGERVKARTSGRAHV